METLSPQVADAIRRSFGRQGLMRTLGARIDALVPGKVTLSLPIADGVSQQHGFAHAGATFALADSAAGYAALTLMPADAEVLTVEMKINLVAPARGVRLIAEGDVIRPGRRITTVRATVMAEAADGSRHTVAVLLGTMIPA